jgi:serine/threonine protein kinase
VSNIRLTDPDLAHNSDNDDDVDWKAKREKWHLTLVDFGFARALSPNDVNPSAHRTRGPEMTQSESDLSINKALDDSSHVLRRSRGKKSSNPDFSRHIIRSLSAVGNREYAAPEVKNKVHQQNTVDKSSHLNVTNTLSEFVSDYGMVADAFSVGSTARFILTGVPPHENVEAVVAWHNSPLNKAARWMGKKLKKQNGKDKPKKKYRSSADIPVEALRMIKGMTQPNELLRTSVRDARMYPYVEQVLGDDTVFKKEMSFLKCSQA